jgi:hypothetical protein
MAKCLNCATENKDDAEFCVNCGFTLHWQEDKPPQDASAEPETKVLLPDAELDPQLARVTVGERTTVRISGGPPPGAGVSWTVLGDASGFSRVHVVDGTATVDVHPGPGEQPRSLPLQLQALGADGPVATAAGTLELLPRPRLEPVGGRGRAGGGGRRTALVVAAVALLAVVVVVVVLATRDSGDVDATVRRFGMLRVHGAPTFSADNVVGHVRQGDKVKVECRTGPFAKIGKHRFVDLKSLSVSGDVPACTPAQVAG